MEVEAHRVRSDSCFVKSDLSLAFELACKFITLGCSALGALGARRDRGVSLIQQSTCLLVYIYYEFPNK